MKLQRPKGTNDSLPKETRRLQFIEQLASQHFASYNFGEIRTPLFEHYEVISRSVGDTSDIVTKEMYDFEDKGGRHITLRPEGTAPVVRSYVEQKLFAPEIQKPVKLWYHGPMFRYERPQAGRLRQFHQIGAEVFGSKNPATDVETIAMIASLFDALELKDVSLHINTLGDQDSRDAYRKALIDYLTPLLDNLSEDSKRRLVDNPLRILDSKDKQDQEIVANAPRILDYLTEASKQYFDSVKTMLEALGLAYEIDHQMVRGLDYYNDTIFEFMLPIAGNTLTLAAGGRYDGLVTYFGGPDTPGFGFGMGVERLVLALDEQGIRLPIQEGVNIYIAVLDEAANVEALKLVESLRRQGFSAERNYLARKIKAQFKAAEQLQADVIVTLGETEVETRQVIVKNNRTRASYETTLESLYAGDLITHYETLVQGEGL